MNPNLTTVYRYEVILTTEEGGHPTPLTLVSPQPLIKDELIRVGKTKWRIKLLLESESQRPHLGDKIAKPLTLIKN